MVKVGAEAVGLRGSQVGYLAFSSVQVAGQAVVVALAGHTGLDEWTWASKIQLRHWLSVITRGTLLEDHRESDKRHVEKRETELMLVLQLAELNRVKRLIKFTELF